MKKRVTKYFLGIGLLACLVFSACGTVSRFPYARASARTADIPQGQSRITRDLLIGRWQSVDGDFFIFGELRNSAGRVTNENVFQSNTLNEGKLGAYEINPILSSYLIVFYTDRNIEGANLFGERFYFEESRRPEQNHLASFPAILSEDRQTLTLGEKQYFRVRT